MPWQYGNGRMPGQAFPCQSRHGMLALARPGCYGWRDRLTHLPGTFARAHEAELMAGRRPHFWETPA
jgi:hypothetical protein